jgi:hypothetical protein
VSAKGSSTCDIHQNLKRNLFEIDLVYVPEKDSSSNLILSNHNSN